MEKGVIKAQKELLSAMASNINVYNAVKEYVKPSDFLTDVYRSVASIIYETNEKNGQVFPAEVVNHFQSVEEQKAVTEIFAVAFKYNDNSDLEKALNENIKNIKKVSLDEKSANATDIEDVMKIVQEKRNLDKLYITITNG